MNNFSPFLHLILMFLVLTIGCLKREPIITVYPYPPDEMYHAYYDNGLLDSLIIIKAESQQTYSVERTDSTFTVYIWDDQDRVAHLKHTLDGNKIKQIEIIQQPDSLYSIEHFKYADGVLDSSMMYKMDGNNNLFLAHKKAYVFIDTTLITHGVNNTLSTTMSDVYDWPSGMSLTEVKLYGDRFELYTPFDLFPFHDSQLNHHLVKIDYQRYSVGRPDILNTEYSYILNDQTLQIIQSKKTYSGASQFQMDTSLIQINYYGI